MDTQKSNIMKKDSKLFDFISISVIAISYIAVAALCLNVFDAKVVVLLGLFVSTGITYVVKLNFGSVHLDGQKKIWPLLAVIILLALVFRADPFPWIHGGQDQGVYSSMSSHYQHGGEIFIEDEMLGLLPNKEVAEIYKNNHVSNQVLLPGLYKGGGKDYVFQFYHLHPLWMAIFGELFGDNNRFYALTFFGLISIVGLMLLTLELSRSYWASFAVGILMATNPLHVFFSKWPVTEVVALAFSSFGLYYLVRAFRELENSSKASINLILMAALSLSLVFFVRITGFLYLPFLLALFAVGIWFIARQKKKEGVNLLVFSVVCILLYMVSVVYGWIYSPNYSFEIYQGTFTRVFGENWLMIIIGCLALVLVFMIVWGRSVFSEKNKIYVDALVKPYVWARVSLVLMVLTIVLALYKAYLVGYTNDYSNNQMYQRWGLVGSGFSIFERSSAINWVFYSSPFLLMVSVIGLRGKAVQEKVALPLMLLSVFLVTTLIINIPVIPYQYYYARYLLSEIVPYAIVISMVILSLTKVSVIRMLGIASVVITLPYFLFYTIKQFPAEEGVRPYSILSDIASEVDDDDTILLDADVFGGVKHWRLYARLEMPLAYYFQKTVLPYTAYDLPIITESYEGLSNKKLWLLTTALLENPSFNLVKNYSYYDKRLEESGKPPKNIVDRYWSFELFLYALKRPCDSGVCNVSFEKYRERPYKVGTGNIYAKKILGTGWYNIEPSHVWSKEKAIINLRKEWFDGGGWPQDIVLEVRMFGASKSREVTLLTQMATNKKSFKFTSNEKEKITIPLGCQEKKKICLLELNINGASSPLSLNRSLDPRVLGIALYNYSFEYRGERN